MSAIVNKHHGRVLYLTDKFGVSQGYLPAFNAITSRVGIPSRSIIITDIYKEVSKPLVKYRNEKTPRFNPDMMAQIKAAVERKIRATKPTLIACSDPVALGLFMNWDQRSATIDKTRGGVYDYDGIKVIIVTPITAINRQFDERMLKDDGGEDIQSEPYRIKNGAWILRDRKSTRLNSSH